jgi:hypothetical protein
MLHVTEVSMPTKLRGAKKPAKRAPAKRAKKAALGPSNSRVQKHREKLRAAGLRPVQIWAYDTKSPAFLAQVKRDGELIRAHEDSRRVDEEMLSIADFSDWKW